LGAEYLSHAPVGDLLRDAVVPNGLTEQGASLGGIPRRNSEMLLQLTYREWSNPEGWRVRCPLT
jgi:hypothetical protein